MASLRPLELGIIQPHTHPSSKMLKAVFMPTPVVDNLLDGLLKITKVGVRFPIKSSSGSEATFTFSYRTQTRILQEGANS